MELSVYRKNEGEQKRVKDLEKLFKHVSDKTRISLEIGARDGHISKILTHYFKKVTALDLRIPDINHEKIVCVQGDATKLDLADNSFDFVCCTEVIEHIPPHLLRQACSELSRVTKKHLLIGVPYKQDIRVGRTTCNACGESNPPWGHVNSFDEVNLKELFPTLEIESISYVGKNSSRTNTISAYLLDFARNPYGIYNQEEGCTHCGAHQLSPPKRNFLRKVSTKIAVTLNNIQRPFNSVHPNWIHVLYRRS